MKSMCGGVSALLCNGATAIRLAALGAFLMAAACGAASSPPPPAPPPPPPPPTGGGGPTWTPGVFTASTVFENRCEAPRTGVDLEGNPFPDLPGSTLEENFWLRSWTDETYLWNDEVVDRNPADFTDPLDYFAVLRTFATTASGRDKDQFHFSQPTDEFLEQRNSAPSATYGARFVAFSTTPPRDFRVQYTEPNSPAAAVVMGTTNLIRGARILEVDGIDLVNGGATDAEIDALNAGLFPATAGETHTFRVQDPGGAPERTITLVSADLAPKPVNRMRIISTPTGDVGYLLINTFSPFASERDIAEAIAALRAAGVSDLVLDLRYNGGGLLAVASQLGYMTAGPARTSGRVFEQLRFNADAGAINPVTGEINDPLPFFTTGLGFSLASGAPLETLNLGRVFVLTTERSCSASESVINSLRGVFVDVILIGETTCGKPFGFYPTDNCGETYFTIQFQGENDVGFGDYADGFAPANSSDAFAVKAPGCAVADDYDHELGDENEAMLAAALGFRETGACPAPPVAVAASARASARSVSLAPIGAGPGPGIMETNRDLTMPAVDPTGAER